MTRKYRPITESEKQYILQNYKTKLVTELSNNLRRSRAFVQNFLIKNNLKPLERYPKINDLTETEHKVMTLVAQGYNKQEICKKMYIAENTLYRYFSEICLRYGLERKRGREVLTKMLLIWLQKNGKLQDWELKGIE